MQWPYITLLQVVTDILHLHGQKLTAYKGDYDTFERTREEQLRNQQKALETSEKARSHMQVRPWVLSNMSGYQETSYFLILTDMQF